MGVIES